MAYYKSGDYLRESTNELFDALLDPEDICFHSGIYRCEACGFEICGRAWREPASQESS